MAEIRLDILDAAYQDGLFDSPLTYNQKMYLSRSIITATQIIDVINVHPKGIGVEPLSQIIEVHKNTTRIYARWLLRNRLIDSAPEGNAIIYYPLKI